MGAGDKKLSRRKFFKRATSGAVLTTGLLAAPRVIAKKTYQWKMVTTWPKNFPAVGTGANFFAEKVKELSEGELSIKVYGSGELVPALGVFDAVSRGTAEMGHGAAYYWKGKHEAAQFFAAVPFGLNAQEMNGWLLQDEGLKLWEELYTQFNLKPFPAGNTGVQMGGWFKKEIKSTKELKGLKMRMPGLGGEVLRRMGVTVVNLPGGEIFQSLRSGALDATEWIGPYNDLAFGFYKAADFYYWPGWHEPGTTLECIINLQKYKALPNRLQQAIKAAALISNQNMLSEFVVRNNSALNTLLTQHKVKIKKFPDDVLKEIGKTAQAVVAEIAQKDPFSKKVYASFDKFRANSVKMSRISEEGYSLSRALVVA